jgi:RNA polymerase sigma factor (sigma-70 family)
MSGHPLPNAQTDEALMHAVAAGDLERLGELFDRHHSAVHALCWRLAGDPDVADDLLQEVFLRVLRFRDSFRGDAAFRTWLFRIAHNVCMDWRRRDRAAREISAPNLVASVPAAEAEPVSALATLVDAAMRTISPDARSVLVLSRYHDMTYTEIAAVVGCSPGAARVRAHRALRELRLRVELIRGAVSHE